MKYFLFFFLILGFVSCTAKKEFRKNDDSESIEDYTTVVKDFITAVKKKKVSKLSKNVFYPLRREIPLPPVEDNVAFTERFSEIFDANLINMISTSNPKTDWAPVGSKGIMFKRGEVWLDFNGALIALNYESNAEKIKRKLLEERVKLNLHPSVVNFEKNMLEMETEGFKLRVDDLGDNKYRLVIWKIQLQTNQKPTDIALNGKMIIEGSGGNHHYTFTAENNFYEVHVTPLGVKYPATFISFDEEMNMEFEQGSIKFKR